MRIDERTGNGHLTSDEAAACLVQILEADGAVFTLQADGYFRCDMDRAAGYDAAKVQEMAEAVHLLRHEIRAELQRRRVIH